MGSKKKPKEVKVNKAKVDATRAELNAQTSRIKNQLTQYRTTQLGNLKTNFDQKTTALNAATDEARTTRSLYNQNAATTLNLMRQQLANTKQTNQVKQRQAQSQVTMANRNLGATQPTKTAPKRNIGGIA